MPSAPAPPSSPRSAWVARVGLCAALVASLLAASGPASAGEGHRKHRRGPPPLERILERHADRLGLDDETREGIRAIAREGREEGKELRREVHERHEAMRALLSQDEPDADAVMRQAERIGAAETELQKQRLRVMLRIRALLSPEQRRELVRIHEERRAEREARREERRERWQPEEESEAGDAADR